MVQRTKAHSEISLPQSHTALRGKKKRRQSSAQQTSRRVWLWHSDIITQWLLEYLFNYFPHRLYIFMKRKNEIYLEICIASVSIFRYSTAGRQMLCTKNVFDFIGFKSSWAALLTQPCTFSFDFPLDPSRLLLHPFQPCELWQWWISLLVPHYIVSQ